MYFITFYDNYYKSVITYSAETKQEITDKIKKLNYDYSIRDIRMFEGKEIISPITSGQPVDYTIDGKEYSRYDIIQKAKETLHRKTNISNEELEASDSFLFKIWQMGWLPESLLKE